MPPLSSLLLVLAMLMSALDSKTPTTALAASPQEENKKLDDEPECLDVDDCKPSSWIYFWRSSKCADSKRARAVILIFVVVVIVFCCCRNSEIPVPSRYIHEMQDYQTAQLRTPGERRNNDETQAKGDGKYLLYGKTLFLVAASLAGCADNLHHREKRLTMPNPFITLKSYTTGQELTDAHLEDLKSFMAKAA